MNYICLSLAPNLRCQDLTRVQSIIIFVPAAVEAFFSVVLALADSSLRGRKRWVLVCDGLSFFVLALLDFLAHLVSGISTSQQVFSVIDFVIAGTSFIPLFAYLLFLLLFAKSNLINSIPSRFRLVVTISLSAIVPLVIVFNQLGSLLGVSHQSIVVSGRSPVLAVGFRDDTFQRISVFFSSAALILLVLSQATFFTLTFVRVVRAFSDERRYEDISRGSAEQIHLFRGLGWLSAGLKLGAIESVVGFAETCFTVVLTRRLLRLFGRGAVIIGVIKGLNVVEDFVQFETQVRTIRSESVMRTNASSPAERTLPAPQFVISNPLVSTFQQLSPNATSFYAAQTKNRVRKANPLSLSLGPNSTFNRFDNQSGDRLKVPTQQRVTVHWDGKAAPVLNVRFSKLRFSMSGLPVALRTPLSAINESPRSFRKDQDADSLEKPLNRLSLSRTSTVSSDSSSEAVLELTSRFPSLPPHALTPTTVGTRDNRSLPSRLQHHDSALFDWKGGEISADVESSMSYSNPVTKQLGLPILPNHPNAGHNVTSRFSTSTFYADEEGSSRDSVDNAVIVERSPLTTPGLSGAATTNTTSMSMLSAFESMVGSSHTTETRSFNYRTSSQPSPFVGDWSSKVEQKEFVKKSRFLNIGFADNETWRPAGKLEIRSISPARKTPPAEMSPVRRSVHALGNDRGSTIALRL